jgi:hypothetical protein
MLNMVGMNAVLASLIGHIIYGIVLAILSGSRQSVRAG